MIYLIHFIVYSACLLSQLLCCVDDCCLLTGDQPDISSKLCQAMEALQDRPVLFKWEPNLLTEFTVLHLRNYTMLYYIISCSSKSVEQWLYTRFICAVFVLLLVDYVI